MEDILAVSGPDEVSFMVLDNDLDDANGQAKVQMVLDIDLDDATGQTKVQMGLTMHEDIQFSFSEFMDSNHVAVHCKLKKIIL